MKAVPGNSAKKVSERARKRAAAVTPSNAGTGAASNPRKDLVLEHLLNKAAELFLQRGYANPRMQDIADSMQMSRSSLYYYFENKEQVLRALTEGDVQGATDTDRKSTRLNSSHTDISRM